MAKDTVKLSKFLSYVLRHHPQAIDLEMDRQGWVDVAELLDKIQKQGKNLTFSLLEQIVASDSKQRYAFNADKTRIRANQGHSISVDLSLTAIEPPAVLYHGTAERNISSIKSQGLLSQNRHHVHLSEEESTAVQVGSRYGKPVVLFILASTMHDDGYIFYRSENGVWLTDFVPVEYIEFEAKK